MNLRQLEVFHAIMSAGSVTGAARLLKISQPAVSAVLKHTEQQMKLKLFERVAGRLQPTPLIDRMVALPQRFDELVFKRFRPQIRIRLRSRRHAAHKRCVSVADRSAFLPVLPRC
jgi:DNA-binding transcriptional LysR family regulator